MPPLLLVEVSVLVQKITAAITLEKRHQDEWRGLAKSWMLDPILAPVTVFSMSDVGYQQAVFSGDAIVQSSLFADWQRTAASMRSL